MNRIAFALATALALSTWSLGQGETPSAKAPDTPMQATVVEAERGRSETKDGLTYLIFSGSVKLTATNLELTCNQLEIFARTQEEEEGDPALGDFSAIQKILATGAVKIVQDQRTATAGRMEVVPNEDVIILDEDPIVYQGAATIDGTGAQLVIHRGKGRIEMIGDAQNKVRISAAPIQDFGYEDDEETIVPDSEANDAPSGEAPEEERNEPSEPDDEKAKSNDP